MVSLHLLTLVAFGGQGRARELFLTRMHYEDAGLYPLNAPLLSVPNHSGPPQSVLVGILFMVSWQQ
jgi:hypothetical protein